MLNRWKTLNGQIQHDSGIDLISWSSEEIQRQTVEKMAQLLLDS